MKDNVSGNKSKITESGNAPPCFIVEVAFVSFYCDKKLMGILCVRITFSQFTRVTL